MLPFMIKPKKQDAGVIMEHRSPDQEPSGQDEAIEAAAKDVMEAINSNDIKRLGKALIAAFQIADSMPHEEGPHEGEKEQS
jgi:hypothetical protein